MDGPDNKPGAAGVAALFEGLKEMTQLNLQSECCMVGIVCQVAVMSWIKQVVLLVCTQGRGRGPRGIMMWVWLQRVG